MSEPSTIPSGCDPVAAQRWAERLARWAQSGLSANAFCDAQGIAKSNFFRWKRKLASTTPPTTDHRTRTTTTQTARTAKTVIVPVRLTPTPAPATPIELALPCGTVVRLPACTPAEVLVAILRGLEGRPC